MTHRHTVHARPGHNTHAMRRHIHGPLRPMTEPWWRKLFRRMK